MTAWTLARCWFSLESKAVVKMDDVITRLEKPGWGWARAGGILVLVATLGACRPGSPTKQDAMLLEADLFLASGKTWQAVQGSAASMEECEAAGMRHVQTVRGLQTMDFRMREFEVARVYTGLQMLARNRGLKDKESEYGRKVAEALERSGAAPDASTTNPPAPRQLPVASGSEADILRTSTERWELAAGSGGSLESCQAAGELHIQTVRGLQFVDPAGQAFEEARVYTRLRQLARTHGVRDKELEYEAKAVEALKRTSPQAGTRVGRSMVDALERKLDPK